MREVNGSTEVREPTSWDTKFFALYSHIAQWSKDKSTKVGAIIVNERNKVVSMGYNGFPIGFDDDVYLRHERPQKYVYTEHAERNAIYSAAELGIQTKGCKMYLCWFPCPDCARAIIQSGISELVCYPVDFTDERWGEGFRKSWEMLMECGVKVTQVIVP